MKLDDRMRQDLGANAREQLERVLEQHFNVARQVMEPADVCLMAMELCCSVAGGLMLVPIQGMKDGGDRDAFFETMLGHIAQQLRGNKARLFAALDAKIAADPRRRGEAR